MVSIRRRKHLGLCSGRHSLLVQFPRVSGDGNVSATFVQDTKSVAVWPVHPLPAVNVNHPEEIHIAKAGSGTSNVSASSTSKEEQNQQFLGQGIKRRKRHRRKHFENQEPCIMRGVYFKNMKWQAAIKVEKKQIHLGTVGSQEAAARLYDRAAFMCGREPNFELPEEEKQELRRFKWDEFLAMTRNSITNKKHQRRHGDGSQRKSQAPPQSDNLNGDQVEGGFSALEENVERHLPVL